MLLEGKAYWTFLANMSQYDKYEVTLSHLSKEMCEKIKDAGFGDKIKTCDKEGDLNKGKYVKLGSRYKVPVYDKTGKEMDESSIGMIGNGSLIQVIVNAKDWTYNKKTGRNLYLEKVKVLHLVKYEAGEQFPDTPAEHMTSDDEDDLF